MIMLEDIIWYDPQWMWTTIMGVVVTVVVGGLITFLVTSIRKLTKLVNKFLEEQETQSEAIRNIIKAFIVFIHDYSTEEKGYIGKYKLDVSERLFYSYERLDGNTYVEDLIKDLRKLPHSKRAKKDK